jgi:hypothetical protein
MDFLQWTSADTRKQSCDISGQRKIMDLLASFRMTDGKAFEPD